MTEPISHDTNDTLILGRYRVLEVRATGGFAQVTICWDRRLCRRVAIKCIPLQSLHASDLPASTIEEALSEARTNSLLSHPNIVSLHDFEMDESNAYLVMEYIDGLTLEEMLARVEGARLTHEECAHILDCVALALTFAHENGVLHLDIKPSNIMIDKMGNVKLTDFGVATLASAAGFTDAKGGTIGYMPPEQIQGEMVDERADIFALSVVLWQAISGSNPFSAPTIEASLKKIKRGPKPKLSESEPSLEGFVEDTLVGCMAYQAVERILNVKTLADCLVPNLGNADKGQQSLVHLLSQTEDTTIDVSPTLLDRQAPFETSRLAPVLFEKLCLFIPFFLISFFVIPWFGITSTFEQVLFSSFCSAVACVAPSLGSLIIMGLLAWVQLNIIVQTLNFGNIEQLALLVVELSAFGCWWYWFGRSHSFVHAVYMFCLSLGQPWAGIPLALTYLQPVQALSTLLCASIMYWCTQHITNGFLQIPTASSTSDGVLFIITSVVYTLICLIGIRIKNRFPNLSSEILVGATGIICVLVQIITILVENGQNAQNTNIIPLIVTFGSLVLVFGFGALSHYLLGTNQPSRKDS